MKELIAIQSELNAPKNLFNKFGNYKYRSCEGILEAVKPLLKKHKCFIKLSDDIALVGERFYIKVTATITTESGQSESVTAYAREEETKKGMDGSQITGAASSYARKYALNGLFAIDDTKDSDDTNTHDEEPKETKQETKTELPVLKSDQYTSIAEFIKTGKTAKGNILPEGERWPFIEERYRVTAAAKKVVNGMVKNG